MSGQMVTEMEELEKVSSALLRLEFTFLGSSRHIKWQFVVLCSVHMDMRLDVGLSEYGIYLVGSFVQRT